MPTYRITQMRPTWVKFVYHAEADSEDEALALFEAGQAEFQDTDEIGDNVDIVDADEPEIEIMDDEDEPEGLFRPGFRVTYVGTLTPRLTGKQGVVTGIKRGGWVLVDFGDGDETECADNNLRLAGT